MDCPECNGKMKKSIEILIHNGNSMPIEVSKCDSCGLKFTNIKNVDKIRKHIKPTISDRIKRIFSTDNPSFVNLYKGKIL